MRDRDWRVEVEEGESELSLQGRTYTQEGVFTGLLLALFSHVFFSKVKAWNGTTLIA